MNDTAIGVAAILGLSFILGVAVLMFARLRIEQQRTMQKLIDRGTSGDELARIVGVTGGAQRDRRRGGLLLAIGFGWSVVTFFIGGKAWLMGLVPIALGIAYLLLSRFNESRR